MGNHRSTTETPGATGRNLQQYAIQVDSIEHPNQDFVKELSDNINPKNEELSKLLGNYGTINLYAPVVEEYLRSAKNYQSLIQEGEEGSFKALNISHQQFFHHLSSIYRQQLLMGDSLQSFRNDLSQKLRRVKSWTKVSAVTFTILAVVISAGAAAITRKPATAAAAAAAGTILLGTIGTWTASHLRKYKDAVKKHVEVTRVMAVGANTIMTDLRGLYSSARRFEFLTMLVSEMAESARAGHEVRKALVESFEELQRKAADFCRDIGWVRELRFRV